MNFLKQVYSLKKKQNIFFHLNFTYKISNLVWITIFKITTQKNISKKNINKFKLFYTISLNDFLNILSKNKLKPTWPLQKQKKAHYKKNQYIFFKTNNS